MAYSPRNASRGGSRAPARRSGGSPMTVVVPVVLVVGVIAAIVVLGRSKGGPPEPPPSTPSVGTPKTSTTPPPPLPPPPYPALSQARIEQIRAEVKDFDALVAQAKTLYDEALAAKSAGKDDVWQAKLTEAAAPLNEIQDRWNEIIASMPSSQHYNEEEVANHYLGKEGDALRKGNELREAIRKSRRK